MTQTCGAVCVHAQHAQHAQLCPSFGPGSQVAALQAHDSGTQEPKTDAGRHCTARTPLRQRALASPLSITNSIFDMLMQYTMWQNR